ncbi:hypothetical protein GJ700_02335 [Duganella sp. FT92W]|uniref:Uncharacterized protein n=1 Tax=Pseudoduganella rivuli TaxID=2666085 RepID=A0A7X2IIQ6_9BURK|nr:hypothetical protein [Pseudoduganella rivuli]
MHQSCRYTLNRITEILTHTEGGLRKRINENRELTLLLQREAPTFIKQFPWVLRWLDSQDSFFIAVESVAPLGADPSDERRNAPRGQ